MFLYTKNIQHLAILPAMAIGFLCVGVLNLNNLRDIVSDRNHGKNTLVVKMGFENGKKYHYILLLLSFVLMLVFHFFNFKGYSKRY